MALSQLPAPVADDTSSPLIRVMALHALAYCERLFYLEEVEEIRVADAAVYGGRRLHEEIAEEEGELTSLVLESEAWGIKGKVDCLRKRDGQLIPYEHKKGRSRDGEEGPEAWPSDRLQVAAYAVLIEEHTGHGRPVPEDCCNAEDGVALAGGGCGKPISEARVRYHADNATVRVPIDERVREDVREAVARARELSRSVERPPVAENERLCVHCSLAPVCLPEEERLVQGSTAKPLRLFPPDRERKSVHVTEHDARISRSGETLVISFRDGRKESLPVRQVGEVLIHGYAQMTTQAIHLCARHDVGVHWLTPGGNYIACVTAGAGPVQRRIRQYEALRDKALTLLLSRRLVRARVSGQLGFILRATRSLPERPQEVIQTAQSMRSSLQSVESADNIDSLRGHEGSAGRQYFGALPALLTPDLDERLRFEGRNRRPPKDCFNALLGFGYSLLYREVMQAIIAVGLEPAFGFYHQPRSSAHPLVLDLMELFRVPMWDMPLTASMNRKQWEPDEDFSYAGEQVWLSDVGRKKAIGIFERRKQETWKHPVTQYSLSYSRLIELEARLLEKEWCGQAGLFAKIRLR